MICEDYFRVKKNGKPTSRCYCTTPWLIENYDKAIADTTQVWECHHRAEICYTRKELIEKGDYYNVPPCNLIFLSIKDHNSLQKGKITPNYTRKKISDSLKRIVHTEDWNEKVSKSLKGKEKTEEHKKHLSEARKGKNIKLHKLLCIETNIIYESIYEASHKTNICGSNIYRCCIGERKSAGGYHWEYIGE